MAAADRRATILAAAKRLFATRGYAATSLDDVAAAAGVSKPVVYDHFDSKRALYFELMRGLRDGASEPLFLFYRCHRATLRARLAIAHLLEPNPRTPEKWPRLARAYLAIAAADAVRLARSFKTRTGRPGACPDRAAGSLRR